MARGEYGNGRSPMRRAYGRDALVGISLFHTVGDRDRAVEQINTEFVTLVSELAHKMGTDSKAITIDFAQMARDPINYWKRVQAATATMAKSPLYPLWRDVVSPVYAEWNKFYADQSSWREFMTNWEEYEHWFDRLKGLRNAVEAEVGPLHSPDPLKLSETLPAKVARKAAEGAGDVLNIVKYAVYGGLALVGVIALSSVAQNLRKGKDPMEQYTAIARSHR
jgi:hypothetical protein